MVRISITASRIDLAKGLQRAENPTLAKIDMVWMLPSFAANVVVEAGHANKVRCGTVALDACIIIIEANHAGFRLWTLRVSIRCSRLARPELNDKLALPIQLLHHNLMSTDHPIKSWRGRDTQDGTGHCAPLTPFVVYLKIFPADQSHR